MTDIDRPPGHHTSPAETQAKTRQESLSEWPVSVTGWPVSVTGLATTGTGLATAGTGLATTGTGTGHYRSRTGHYRSGTGHYRSRTGHYRSRPWPLRVQASPHTQYPVPGTHHYPVPYTRYHHYQVPSTTTPGTTPRVVPPTRTTVTPLDGSRMTLFRDHVKNRLGQNRGQLHIRALQTCLARWADGQAVTSGLSGKANRPCTSRTGKTSRTLRPLGL